MFFFWPIFAPQQQKEKEKRCDVYKRVLILTNIGHNVFLLANFCTTSTQKKKEFFLCVMCIKGFNSHQYWPQCFSFNNFLHHNDK
jgi:hypothetical protein